MHAHNHSELHGVSGQIASPRILRFTLVMLRSTSLTSGSRRETLSSTAFPACMAIGRSRLVFYRDSHAAICSSRRRMRCRSTTSGLWDMAGTRCSGSSTSATSATASTCSTTGLLFTVLIRSAISVTPSPTGLSRYGCLQRA